MPGFVVWLPFPPSVNNLYINVGKRRCRSKRYDAWRAKAEACLSKQIAGKVAGPYTISMIVERPDRRKRDLDGLLKAPIDLLVSAGLTPDDSFCHGLTVHWQSVDPVKDAGVIITVEPA